MDNNGKLHDNKPHAVCIPFPIQSHINAMLKVAKLLHERAGFHITFVNTEYNHKRILKSRGSHSLDDLPNFHFKTIPDGMAVPEADDNDDSLDLPTLCLAISKKFLQPFRSLIAQIKNDGIVPCVSCIVGDGMTTSFTIQVAEEFDVPVALFWPISACSLLGFMHFRELLERGIIPLKDESYLTNGYLETIIDWIPGMKNNTRLKDLPSFAITTDPNDVFLNFFLQEMEGARNASAIILNTMDVLEQEVLEVFSNLLPPIYTIGPLHLFTKQTIKDQNLKSKATNLWKEDPECINWLNSKPPNSVIYVNFGSLTVMKPRHLIEFAWGLANSENPFLWIIRPDLVRGDSAILPLDFVEKITEEQGMIASWCAQEEVLKHPSIGGFLTHCGWNSVVESLCEGVPMIIWPFFADQPTNCRYCCVEWGIGLELDGDVKRDDVERCIKELMEGEKGKDMKKKIMELKNVAEESCKLGGSSYRNLDELVVKVLKRGDQ